jgi:arylsulfatase A-like enzyme
MKLFIKTIVLSCCLLSLTTQAANKPNIFLILVDDMGWRDAGFMGNTYIETPALDKLAREGLVFNKAYSNAPNCAPSRAAIMSGQYAPRTQVYTMIKGDMGNKRLRRVLTPPNKVYLEPSVITLAEMLKSAGYRTAQIGKWNLGTGEVRGPLGQGFDSNIAGSRSGDAHNGYFSPYGLTALADGPRGEYLTDRLSQEAVRIIEEKNSQPFFIYLSHFAPHYPYQAPEALIKKYTEKKNSHTHAQEPMVPEYAAMIESVDRGLDLINKALEEKHLVDNTLIIFTSDNGGYDDISYMEPLRGQKSLLYEGGIRVPMLIKWPQQIKPGISDEAVIGVDIFPTLMHAANVATVNQPLDGHDLSPLFKGGDKSLARDALYWYFPGYVAGNYDKSADRVFQQRPAAVIRKANWKLIQYFDSDRFELYDLAHDPAEKNNRITSEPQRVSELKTALQQWLSDMHAPLPLAPNPDYSPFYNSIYENFYANSWLSREREKMGPWFRQPDL